PLYDFEACFRNEKPRLTGAVFDGTSVSLAEWPVARLAEGRRHLLGAACRVGRQPLRARTEPAGIRIVTPGWRRRRHLDVGSRVRIGIRILQVLRLCCAGECRPEQEYRADKHRLG